MWIERNARALLEQRMAHHPVVVLTGARQTGKTSLARRTFPDRRYVSLDLPSEAEQAERDPQAFLARHPPPVTVDEVQYAPGLFRHLKLLVDERRDEAGLFLLTGSQQLSLMRTVSESLAGRAAVLLLEGLSWQEIRRARPELDLPDLLLRGGFPELYRNLGIDVQGYHRSYLATYLERDLRQQLRVDSLRDFERFLRASALRTANLLNKASLARDVGISPSTAAAWISALEASGQVVLQEPWFSNRTRSLVKSPKLHLADSGTCAFLMGLRSTAELLGSPLAPALWESAVLAELRRCQVSQAGGWELYFWRDRSKEADLLLHRGGRFWLGDVKWSEHPVSRDARTLCRVARELPEGSVERTALLSRAPNPYPLPEGVEVLGWPQVGDWLE